MTVRTLGEVERDRVWRSTFSGAQYRWSGDQWEVKTSVADWHPVKAYEKVQTVTAWSTERFEVVA